MKKDELRIYGASDDLIEFEGSIRDEIDAYESDITFNLSDGAEVRVYWDDCRGWVNEVIKKGQFEIEEIPGDEEADTTPITIIKGRVKWAKYFEEDDNYREIPKFIGNLTERDLSADQLKVYKLLADIALSDDYSDPEVIKLALASQFK